MFGGPLGPRHPAPLMGGRSACYPCPMSNDAPVESPPGELERIELELEQFKAKYQALVEQIPAVLYINLPDEDETTIYVSPQTDSILGVGSEEWFGDGATWDSHVHPADRQRVIENYQGFVRSASEGVDEYRFVRPDGEVIWIHDRVRIIRDKDGASQLVQGVIFDVTQQKEAEGILRQQAELQEKVDAIGREFTDLVLGGAGLGQILDVLERIVENPVVLEDAAHQLVEFSSRSAQLADVLEGWAAHSRTEHDREPGTIARLGTISCAWISVRLRDEEWGRIHVLDLVTPIDQMTRLALDRAAASIGLSLLAERDAAHLAENARATLLSDIWRGRFSSAQEVIGRARGLGAELEGRKLAAIVVEADRPETDADRSDEGERQRLRHSILAAVRHAFESAGSDGLAALVGDRVLGVLGVGEGGNWRALGLELAENVQERMGREFPELAVFVGLSNEAEPGSLRRALNEANESAAFGVRTTTGSSIHHYDDLGVRRLLARIGDGPELAQFVEAELGPLMKHDASGGAPLVETLRAFLEAGGGKAEAARALHLERRSMYYRLEKIESLLKRSVSDHESRLRLGLALHCLDLLQQRPASAERAVRRQDMSHTAW